jgi:hypothetical protein
MHHPNLFLNLRELAIITNAPAEAVTASEAKVEEFHCPSEIPP